MFAGKVFQRSCDKRRSRVRPRGRIRILHADDHLLIRMGVSALVRTANDMEMVGEAMNGRQAVELADSLKPDVVIMDLMMPEMLGSEATRLIHESHPEIKVLVLTTRDTTLELGKAIMYGAAGVVFKEDVDRGLIWTIRSVAAGQKAIPAWLLSQIEEDNAFFNLTARQLDILDSIADGQSNLDIARQFGLTEVTIKKHLSAVFRCLGVANRSEAVALAMQKHVIKPRAYLSETRTGVLAGRRVSSSILSSGEKEIFFSARNERSFAGVS